MREILHGDHIESVFPQFHSELVRESFRFFERRFGIVLIYAVEDFYLLVFYEIFLVVSHEKCESLGILIEPDLCRFTPVGDDRRCSIKERPIGIIEKTAGIGKPIDDIRAFDGISER